MTTVTFTAYTVETITSSGTWTCPSDVSEITYLFLWAGGGGGQSSAGITGGAGGGAGGMVQGANYPVTPGGSYSVTIGSGGAADTDGSDSWFVSSSTFLAKAGHKGAAGVGGAGGVTSAEIVPGNVGDVKYQGGSGGNAASAGGGGGGASPSTLMGNGANGSDGGVSAGGAGGAGVESGGNDQGFPGLPFGDSSGGDGGTNGGSGSTAGQSPGAGGGGGSPTGTASAGANGQLVLIYRTANTQTWTCPVGITSVQVENWGAGGGGGGAFGDIFSGHIGGGGGGGGGGYSRSLLTVVPETVYTFQVGLGGAGGTHGVGYLIGSNGADGTDTWFNTSSTVKAGGGKGAGTAGNGQSAGAAGGGYAGIGDVVHGGGYGGSGVGTLFSGGIEGGGGGGGSSAGYNAIGNSGSNGLYYPLTYTLTFAGYTATLHYYSYPYGPGELGEWVAYGLSWEYNGCTFHEATFMLTQELGVTYATVFIGGIGIGESYIKFFMIVDPFDFNTTIDFINMDIHDPSIETGGDCTPTDWENYWFDPMMENFPVVTPPGGSDGAGGVAPDGGSDGGNGGILEGSAPTVGLAANFYPAGGGGGGGGDLNWLTSGSDSSRDGAAGADGRLVLTYPFVNGYSETGDGGVIINGHVPPTSGIQYAPNWDDNWSTTAIHETVVDAAATTTTEIIDNDGKSCCEVSVSVDYGNATATFNAGLYVYLLRDLDGTNYEVRADVPWGFNVGFTPNTTWRQNFSVNCYMISSFKICVYNGTNQDATVTINYRQATMDKT